MDPTFVFQLVAACALIFALSPALSFARTVVAYALLCAILVAGHVGKSRVDEDLAAEVAVRAVEKIIQGRRPAAAPAIHWHSL